MTRPASIERLRPYNLAAGALHLAQAIAIVALANGFALPVVASYMNGPPGAHVCGDGINRHSL